MCLDVKGGRVVKGVQFESLRDVGDPVELAQRYEADGADEIVFLDISASAEERATLLDLARRTAERLFIPLTIGGGIRSADDVARALRAGADKVGSTRRRSRRRTMLTECAERFGVSVRRREHRCQARRPGLARVHARRSYADVARRRRVGAGVRPARRRRAARHQHRSRRRAHRLRSRADRSGR